MTIALFVLVAPREALVSVVIVAGLLSAGALSLLVLLTPAREALETEPGETSQALRRDAKGPPACRWNPGVHRLLRDPASPSARGSPSRLTGDRAAPGNPVRSVDASTGGRSSSGHPMSSLTQVIDDTLWPTVRTASRANGRSTGET
ncbi:hypothetical protein JHN59_42230 [Streptomyces sp. MBT49]|uniref:hypothetical protein n=1 Tax=Streptomyces sp. MBT49 TaxID=1488380 RepID=UPI00190BAD74|nr:hypothetical protein [Streptomyces sp. MBT49]MBK3631275.1 hypothetical protein [Streptomyces sp. MBT49]